MERIETALESWVRAQLPLYEFMDLEITSVSDGLYQCRVPLGRNTGNHVNTFHAALQFAAAEILGGLIVLSRRSDEKYVPVVKRLDIEYRRPALSDITAEVRFADAQVEVMNAALATDGRYDFELRPVIRDAAGEVVAEATGYYAVRTMEP